MRLVGYARLREQPDAFDAIEAAVREVFFAEAGAS